MKKRTIMISLVVLGFLLMIGVGFAAWTITNPNAGAQSTATVKAYAVQSEDYNLTLSFVASAATDAAAVTSPKVIFGKPADTLPSTTYNWLGIASTDDTQSLDLFLKITIDKIENFPDEGLPISFASSDPTAWTTCTTGTGEKSYVSGPTYAVGSTTLSEAKLSKTNFTIASGETGSATCVLKISFAWGSLFGGDNPFVYYNGNAYTTTLATEAATALEAIYGLEATTYTFTIGTVA